MSMYSLSSSLPNEHGWQTDNLDTHVRVLQPEHWPVFRALRLEALQLDGRFFATSYETEKNYPDSYWQNLCTESPDHCVIGLFDTIELIGITMIMSWAEDATGSTALFGRSYIRPECRQRGLAVHLYRTRIEWAQSQPKFKSAVVFHRAGNFVSKKINERYGAEYWCTRQMQWADGETDAGLWYRIPLKEQPAKQA